MTKSDQFELYKELYELEEGEKINLKDKETRNKLASFIGEKRESISLILEGEKIEGVEKQGKSWYEFIAENREKFRLPKFIPYKVYNIYIQLISTHKEEDVNFDDFLRLFENKRFREKKEIENASISHNIENLMNNGGGSDFHALSEIISNAIDATNPQNVVGRFGRGFFQIGRF